MSSHYLVAFDQSPQSRDALEYVLGTFPDAQVTVVYVTDPQEWLIDGGSFDSLDADIGERVRNASREVLDDAEAIAAEHGREIEAEVVTGTPAKEIIGYAEDKAVDHIVLGSHGRTGFQRILIGSVAEEVVRRSSVPVTVMRGDWV